MGRAALGRGSRDWGSVWVPFPREGLISECQGRDSDSAVLASDRQPVCPEVVAMVTALLADTQHLVQTSTLNRKTLVEIHCAAQSM